MGNSKYFIYSLFMLNEMGPPIPIIKFFPREKFLLSNDQNSLMALTFGSRNNTILYFCTRLVIADREKNSLTLFVLQNTFKNEYLKIL